VLRRVAATTTALVYLQIVIGATMRHTDAGLAIPDFPWAFGHLIPPQWDPKIAIHFAHRLGALVVTLAITATTAYIRSRARNRREMTRPAALLVALVATQVTLGALTVLSRRDPWINSFHVVCGAMVLTTSLVLTLRAWRTWFVGATVRLKPDTAVGLRASAGSVRLQADGDPARGRA
jgi:cytochrome c oxidase assembly protein subunit 15